MLFQMFRSSNVVITVLPVPAWVKLLTELYFIKYKPAGCPNKYIHWWAKQFIITLIIISFSSGFDSAIIIVSATRVWSSINFPLSENRTPFLSRKCKNMVAAMRLFPSEKLWFFVIKYRRFAAFSSRLGYNSWPANDWYIFELSQILRQLTAPAPLLRH